jgi:hypothetical protein
MGGPVALGTLELQHDLARAITLEPFVGNGGAGVPEPPVVAYNASNSYGRPTLAEQLSHRQ